LPSEKEMKLVQSQVRERISRQPSASSERNRVAAGRAIAGSRMAARNAALTTKLPASAAKTQPAPAVATITPETAGPKTLVALCESERSAFASWSRSRLTV
jgi:hypothetical protein